MLTVFFELRSRKSVCDFDYLFTTSTNFIQTRQKHRQIFRQKFILNYQQPGTFKCARSRCKTCPFIHNVEKMSGPKRSIKITNHFTCTSANIICCVTCTYRKKLYIAETGRRQGDQFREHRDVEEMTRKHPNHNVRLKSLAAFPCIQAVRKKFERHLGSQKAEKPQNKNLSFKLALLIPTTSTSAFHSTDLFLFSRFHLSAKAQLYFLHINTHTTHNSSIRSDKGLTLETSTLKLSTVDNFVIN